MHLYLCNEHEASKITEKEGQLAGSGGVEEGGWENRRGGGRKELINKKDGSKAFFQQEFVSDLLCFAVL